MRILRIMLGLLLLTPITAASAPPTYSAKPIHGTVVDAETGRPLEGVIVVAQWILYEASVGGQNPRKRLQVLETVTAPDGTYAFPGWGPKLNLPVINPFGGYFCCFLTNRDPLLNLFKPGYRPLSVLNQIETDVSVRTSDWDGKTIRLERFRGDSEAWARELDLLQGDLAWGDVMEWRRLPRMTLAILRQKKELPWRLQDRVSGAGPLGTTEEEVQRLVEAGQK
jgi:hypothetical protein